MARRRVYQQDPCAGSWNKIQQRLGRGVGKTRLVRQALQRTFRLHQRFVADTLRQIHGHTTGGLYTGAAPWGREDLPGGTRQSAGQRRKVGR